MEFRTINRDSTTEIIIQQIKEQISNGTLKAGEKLPSERSMAESFGVSRTAVREAIQALSFSGYLDVQQGRGAFITGVAPKYDEICRQLASISEFSLMSLMEVREMLEGEFARLAAIRADKNDIYEIKKALKEMKKAESDRLFVIKDLEFHQAVARATHNPLMDSLMRIFGELLHKETSKLIDHSLKWKNLTLECTEEVIEAISRRDARTAREAMLKHLKSIEISLQEEQ